MASALVFKWCQDLYSNLVPTAFAASRRPRGAVIPAGEVDSRFVVPLPRPGGRRSLRGQLHLDLRPLEAHEDASISTVLTDMHQVGRRRRQSVLQTCANAHCALLKEVTKYHNHQASYLISKHQKSAIPFICICVVIFIKPRLKYVFLVKKIKYIYGTPKYLC